MKYREYLQPLLSLTSCSVSRQEYELQRDSFKLISGTDSLSLKKPACINWDSDNDLYSGFGGVEVTALDGDESSNDKHRSLRSATVFGTRGTPKIDVVESPRRESLSLGVMEWILVVMFMLLKVTTSFCDEHEKKRSGSWSVNTFVSLVSAECS